MKIALMAVDSKRFNFALAKISAYHKAQGDEVEWYDGMFGQYDRLYMSKIFNFTHDYRGALTNASEIVRGGTGYSLTATLPEEIERCLPDYSIYPDVDARTSYGFLTRGCPNRCKWCVVPAKEGAAKPYADIDEVTENGKRPYAVLMDNNILATDYGLGQIEKIIDRKYHVDFNQALDARLVTPEIARMLAKVRWIGSIVRFGCDTPKQVDECERAMRLMAEFGYKGQWLMYCMIHGTIQECYDRLNHWRTSEYAKKVRIVAQPFRDPFAQAHLAPSPNGKETLQEGQCAESSTSLATSRIGFREKASSAQNTSIPQWHKDMAHWATKHQLFATCDFKDFSPRKGFTCNEYFKTQEL